MNKKVRLTYYSKMCETRKQLKNNITRVSIRTMIKGIFNRGFNYGEKRKRPNRLPNIKLIHYDDILRF